MPSRNFFRAILFLLIMTGCAGSQAPVPARTTAVTTIQADNLTFSSAVTGVSVTTSENIKSIGFCWSLTPNPKMPTTLYFAGPPGSLAFTRKIVSLALEETYYVRGFADNGNGIIYGEQISFSTRALMEGPTDIDGNKYRAIQIGSQTWMADNLKVTRYRNGDIIPNVQNSNDWENAISGAWCSYNNDSQMEVTYGKLYNWFAAVDNRNVCPVGWHVPSANEWELLKDFLGPFSGRVMKAVGTKYWSPESVNLGVGMADNLSGFTGIPSGERYVGSGSVGFYGVLGWNGYWSSTQKPSFVNTAITFSLNYNSDVLLKDDKIFTQGLCIRCIKD